MKRHFSLLLICTMALLLTLSSCRKYPDGPNFTLRSKTERVVNNWQLELLLRNDIDETVDQALFEMSFTKSGRFSWRIQPMGAQAPVEVSADWEFASVKEQIKLTFDEKDPLTGETRLLFMDIIRLTEDELWLEYLTEGDYYRIRLKDL